jgi:hypothetical protein
MREVGPCGTQTEDGQQDAQEETALPLLKPTQICWNRTSIKPESAMGPKEQR